MYGILEMEECQDFYHRHTSAYMADSQESDGINGFDPDLPGFVFQSRIADQVPQPFGAGP